LCVNGLSIDNAGGTRFGENSCIACGANMMSFAGSSSKVQCKCRPGYVPSDPFVDTCVPCAQNSYQDIGAQNGELVCKICPDEMTTSLAAASSITECQCPVGKFKLRFSSRLCSSCELDIVGGIGLTSLVGTVRNPPDQPIWDVCYCDPERGYTRKGDGVACHCDTENGFTTRSGGEGCEGCPPGKEPHESTCQQCAFGKYKPPGILVRMCQSCPIGQFAPFKGAVSCETCPGRVTAENLCILTFPEINTGVSALIFDHFQDSITVKMVLNSAVSVDTAASWQSGDHVTVYATGMRDLSPTVLIRMFDGSWSPVNVDPVHSQYTVYVISTLLDKMQGQGTYHYSDGSVYTGQWLKGKRMGACTYTKKNGDKYEGNWLDNGAQGLGKMKYQDGSVYEGEWFANIQHGNGKMLEKDGNYYDGQWDKDKMTGAGIKTNGRSTYTGKIIDGVPSGEGFMRNAKGDVYMGTFIDAKADGIGRMDWANKSYYTGRRCE